MTAALIRRFGDTQTHTKGEHHGMEAETEVECLQAKECSGLPGASEAKREGKMCLQSLHKTALPAS